MISAGEFRNGVTFEMDGQVTSPACQLLHFFEFYDLIFFDGYSVYQ